MDKSKLRRDGAPIVLFALIVGAKLYALWLFLTSNPQLWQLIRDFQVIGTYAPGARYYLINQLSYLLYFVTAIAFDALAFYSFIVRSEAKSRPQGFWENAFPLLTVFVPVISFTLLSFPQVRQLLPGYSPETIAWLRSLSPLYAFYLSLAGFTLGFIGVCFSIWSISHLRRSFGLRAAVRTLVTSGPYARIRHPLYLGEIVPCPRDCDPVGHPGGVLDLLSLGGLADRAGQDRGAQVPADPTGVRGLPGDDGVPLAAAGARPAGPGSRLTTRPDPPIVQSPRAARARIPGPPRG